MPRRPGDQRAQGLGRSSGAPSPLSPTTWRAAMSTKARPARPPRQRRPVRARSVPSGRSPSAPPPATAAAAAWDMEPAPRPSKWPPTGARTGEPAEPARARTGRFSVGCSRGPPASQPPLRPRSLPHGTSTRRTRGRTLLGARRRLGEGNGCSRHRVQDGRIAPRRSHASPFRLSRNRASLKNGSATA